MASAQETAIQAVITALEALDVPVRRGGDVPETIPPEGHVWLIEGDAQVDVVMSPLTYMVDINVQIAAAVIGVDEHDRDARSDALVTAITAALVTLRADTEDLDWIEINPVSKDYMEATGPGAVATIPVTLSFTSADAPTA